MQVGPFEYRIGIQMAPELEDFILAKNKIIKQDLLRNQNFTCLTWMALKIGFEQIWLHIESTSFKSLIG